MITGKIKNVELVGAGAQRNRNALNRTVILCILFVSTLLLVACQTTSTKDGGNEKESGILNAEIEIVPFESLQKEADLIVEIKLIEKIDEVNSTPPESIFEMEIQNVFKGDKEKLNEKITVSQTGNSHWIYEDNKYTLNEGVSYILFLKETIGNYASDYWILNDIAGLFVVDDDVVIKLVYEDKELNDILIETPSVNATPKIGNHSKEYIQFLDKEKFLERISE